MSTCRKVVFVRSTVGFFLIAKPRKKSQRSMKEMEVETEKQQVIAETKATKGGHAIAATNTQATLFLRVPIPSICTSTTSPDFNGEVFPGVPV
jgi:hypothetical protein